MIALELTDIKDFMNKLLCTELFDRFLLQEATVTGAASFTVDGRLHREFFSSDEIETLGLTDCAVLPYGMLRTNCFDLIKGKRTPSYFKFVFLLSPESLARTLASINSSFTPQDITAICFNIRYQNQLLSFTTGISYRIFSPDRSLEQEWDGMMRRFLTVNQIEFKELA